jgi:uncharacterized protein GlcG (DUF336 family)
MLKPPYLLAVATAATISSLPANAQGVLAERNISLGLAMTIAQSALESCRANGFHVSVTVVDRAGQVRVALRDDNASPHTFENSQRKAYTARTFRVPSAEFATRMAGDPVKAQLVLPGVIALAGALPIKAGDEIIGAVGVSGAPGGEKAEACAKTGIDKVADQLK